MTLYENSSSWQTEIATTSATDSTLRWIDTGISFVSPPLPPWGSMGLDYRIGENRYSYAESDNCIKVDKGSPAKARYAVFYAVNKDPVIFCRTRRDMIKEVKALLKRKEVDPKSIRIFALVGGAKVVKK